MPKVVRNVAEGRQGDDVAHVQTKKTRGFNSCYFFFPSPERLKLRLFQIRALGLEAAA